MSIKIIYFYNFQTHIETRYILPFFKSCRKVKAKIPLSSNCISKIPKAVNMMNLNICCVIPHCVISQCVYYLINYKYKFFFIYLRLLRKRGKIKYNFEKKLAVVSRVVNVVSWIVGEIYIVKYLTCFIIFRYFTCNVDLFLKFGTVFRIIILFLRVHLLHFQIF